MICPECQQQGLKSKVYFSESSTTLAYSSPFYDEDGTYHFHDPNPVIIKYTCSNGHKWTVSTKKWCSGCDLNKEA